MEGGGCPSSASARCVFGAARGAGDSAPAVGDSCARFVARSSSMRSAFCGKAGHSSAGGGGGCGGEGGCRGGGGGCVDARCHCRRSDFMRKVVALSSSARCATARSVLRCCDFVGELGCERAASCSDLVGCGFSSLRIHVMLPSLWTRNECIFISSASVAACRMTRRVARLNFGRSIE